jgi:hypothetical protein
MTWNEATIEEPLARDFLGAILGTTSARCMRSGPINRIPLGETLGVGSSVLASGEPTQDRTCPN